MARPRKSLPPGARRLILAQAENGLAETKVCEALGLNWQQWKKLLAEDEATQKLWEEALAIERDRIVQAMHSQALDGDMQAARFLLAARHGLRENAAQEGESKPNVTISLPPSLTKGEYERLRQGTNSLAPSTPEAVTSDDDGD